MHAKEDSRLREAGSHAPAEPSHRFEELAASLDSVASRALEEQWPGWRPEDTEAIATAAREIRAIPKALAAGAKDAFTVGRRYGRGEDELAELNAQIGALSRRLARQAWGGGRSGLA